MEKKIKHLSSRYFSRFLPDRQASERETNHVSPSNAFVPVPCTTPLPLHELQRVRLQPLSDNRSDSDRKRWLTVNQFITHEQNYLDALHKLQYEIYNPLVQDDAIVDRAISYAIFSTHRQICQLHQFAQVLLEACVSEWPQQNQIGWMIWAMVGQPSLLPLYQSFVQSYADVVAIFMREVDRNFLFSWFVTTKLQELGERLSFSDYFIMTVQRIPQLVLEIKELYDATSANHPDRAILGRCLKRVEFIAEQLNTAKRQGDMVQTILGAMERLETTKDYNFAHGRHQCQLLHSELLEEIFTDGSCERLIVLLSDRLASIRPQQLDEQVVQQKRNSWNLHDRYWFGSLEWVLPLQELELGSFMKSDGLQEKPDEVCSADAIRYIRDFETITHMRELVCTFTHVHNTLNERVFGDELDRIWSTLLPERASDQEANVLYVKGMFGEAHFLQTKDTDSKKEWYDWIRLSKLALDPANLPAWFNSASYITNNVQYAQPLFVQTLHAGDSQGIWTVTGGCCYAPNYELYTNELLRAWSSKQHILWVSSVDREETGSRISLYTHNRLTNMVDERANLTLPDTTVSCIEHVPVGMVDDVPSDTVWIGTWKKLLIYSATFPLIHARLKMITIKGTPNRILYNARRVLIGTVAGRLLIFSILPDGVWNLRTPQQIFLQDGSVEAMTLYRSKVYLAAGTKLHVFDSTEGVLVKMISSPLAVHEDKQTIILLKCSIHGLWIVRHRSKEISLYHAECFKHLLDVDVQRHVLPFLTTSSNEEAQLPSAITVTSLVIMNYRLWVGTNIGIVLSGEVPQYANVPIKVDLLTVACHGHLQNVNVIIPIPSLRICDSAKEDPMLDPLLVDKLYKNTRKSVRDLNVDRVGIERDEIEFIDTAGDGLGATCYNIVESTEEEAVATSLCLERLPEQASSNESSEPAIAPNTGLIVTGGQGYTRWYSKMAEQQAVGTVQQAVPSHRAQPVDQVWMSKKIDVHENIVLWEMRLT